MRCPLLFKAPVKVAQHSWPPLHTLPLFWHQIVLSILVCGLADQHVWYLKSPALVASLRHGGDPPQFVHEKDFWFKQIWVDLHQTMVLDRQGSYTRPVLGLVRCVCKDETDQTERGSPIKMRICNLHFFASIWMAQLIVHNFLKPREPGYIVYKEGWYEWDGKQNMKKKLLLVTCWAVYASWSLTTMWNPSITKDGDPLSISRHKEIKDAIWTARLGCLELKARIDIPQVEKPPPTNSLAAIFRSGRILHASKKKIPAMGTWAPLCSIP